MPRNPLPPVSGRQIRRWRRALGLTQVEAAHQLQIGARTLGGYEQGRTAAPGWLSKLVRGHPLVPKED